MFHSSFDLRYLLLSGPVSLTRFRVLQSHHLEWREFHLGFYVLAVSHALCIKSGDRQVTEFLSCASADADAGVIAEASVADLPWEVTKRVLNLEYSCRITSISGTEDDRFHGAFEDRNQMTAAYPILPGYATPFTRIGWGFDHAGITVETIHTYPQENRIVRSESVVRRAEEAESHSRNYILASASKR